MLANKTTTVDAAKSVADIQQLLARNGATRMLVQYEGSDPVALSFTIVVNESPISFQLPCHWPGVLRALRKEVPPRLQNAEHARRVGWRILREWLRAQLSLIASGSSTIEEVMLPWAITQSGNTVSQDLLSGRSKLLGLPEPKE